MPHIPEEIPISWLMPRTKAGRDELKKRMNRILKLLELVEDKQLREMIKSNLPLSDDNYLD
tara:strand:- start:292 stop:474 length:183 start_codon:yes stop_codon:yes gene_type:complete